MNYIPSNPYIHIQFILFIFQIIIFFSHNDQVKAKPMFGRDVLYARERQFPFVVSLSRRNPPIPNAGMNHICTGFLITRQDVLTSGKCFAVEHFTDVSIVIGSIDIEHGTRFDVYWWITYVDWCNINRYQVEYEDNSIGNIRLRERVHASMELAMISHLPNNLMYNRDVVIAAWGRNRQDIIPTRLRMARLRTSNINACRLSISTLAGYDIDIDDRYLCSTANPYIVMHNGDAGAPVMIDGMVVAIHRRVMPHRGSDIDPDLINVHLTLNYYRNFINSVTDPNFNRLIYYNQFY